MARSLFAEPDWPTDRRQFDIPLTIGVVSDTHVHAHGARRFPPEVPDLFARFNAGLILHAGDVNTGSVLDALAEVAPLIAITGNNDDIELQSRLEAEERFTVGRFRFALRHGHGGRSARSEARVLAADADCVIYGHSHIPLIEDEGGTILFNPGSATDRRWQEHFGIGLIHITQSKIDPELVLYDDPRHLVNIRP
ncbi:MAG: metallophosphoesterase family protein [Thermomicrobiales bacterium]